MGCDISKKPTERTYVSTAVSTGGGSDPNAQQTSAQERKQSHLSRLPDQRPEISDKQKKVIMESWTILQEDIAKVGVVMFMNLFETHPDVQEVFLPYRNYTQEDMRYSKELKAHALRVMGTVEKCLARIDEPEKLVALLHDLGRKHVTYNAKPDYVDLIGPQFVFAIQPALGDHWSLEVEEAWGDLFKFVGHVMKEAMYL